MRLLGVIDFHGLGQVIWVSLAAGVSVTVLYSFVIYASVKGGEARRGGRTGTGVAYVALAAFAMVVFLGATIVGVIVMLNKS
jgi:hypothetical protein